jgi:hypothetical protein
MLQGGSRHIATALLFMYPKLNGLSSEQKLNLNMRHNLSWWIYPPLEVWEDVYAERGTSAGQCEAATHARIWLDKGKPTTNAFQENTKWSLANSISGESFSLSIERIRLGIVNDYCCLCAELVAYASIPPVGGEVARYWRKSAP